VDLYSAFLTTAPFILLAVSGGVTFGPMPVAGRHRVRRVSWWWLANDISAVTLVVLGAALSLLVLGAVVPASPMTRLGVVAAGLLSLFFLLLHVVGDVLVLHRAGADPGAAQP
jgi:hypothetical protein